MKKIPLILTCCIMAVCGASCNNDSSNNSDNNSTVSFGQIQKNGSGEEALKDFFTANYTRDAGEAAFSYMYIQPIIDNMIEKNEYRQRVLEYNSGKNQFLDLVQTVPYIKSIDETTALTEEQLGWAEQYLIDYAASMNISIEDITVTEGYNFKCTVVDYNNNEKPDVECLVKVEGDGWKYVGSLNTLESMYGSETETTSENSAQ